LNIKDEQPLIAAINRLENLRRIPPTIAQHYRRKVREKCSSLFEEMIYPGQTHISQN